MAKDNLTSKEWCDLIFQGKNKEYGAYRIRLESTERYNRSMFIILVVVLVGFSLLKINEVTTPKQDEVVVEVSTISQLDEPIPDNPPKPKSGPSAKKGGGAPKQQKVSSEKPGAAPVVRGEAIAVGNANTVNKVKSDQVKIVQQVPAEDENVKAEKASAAAANKLVANAFGRAKSAGGNGAGTTGTGKGDGSKGNGSFDLDGRSLGPDGLPHPSYNVREEGRVVVTIVVNPEGQVIRTSINKMTNTTNPALRKAAEDAAKKARFNSVHGLNNQTGTITYYFKLK
jgi:TonB family protein